MTGSDRSGVMAEGDVTVIGPECFASADERVICWRGENYYRAPESGDVAGLADSEWPDWIKRLARRLRRV